MANVFRGRWDTKSNPKGVKEYAVDTAVAVEVGDLMWLDTDDAKPASHANLWTGTEAGARGNLADKFIGIAVSGHAANDTTVTSVRVAGKGVWSMPVGTPATFEVGDHVGGDKAAGSTLLAQSVEKVTDESTAIGRVAKRYPANTSIVHFEILGRGEAGGGNRAFRTS
jgi:hypothetical protein